MRRWWGAIALILSVGMNVGILATVATHKVARQEEAHPAVPETPAETPLPSPRESPALPATPPPAQTPAPPPPQASPPPAPEPRPDRPPPPPPPPEDMADGPEGEPSLPRLTRLADRLGLEGEPRRRFLEVQQRFFEETVRIRLQMAESQREARRQLVAAHPDAKRIDEALQASARDYLALEQALVKNVAATREILTPRQEQEYLLLISRLRPQGAVPGQAQPMRRRPPPWQDQRPFRRPGGRLGGMNRPQQDRPEPPPEDDGPPPADEPPQ